jgi:hypothetical protein
MPLNCTINFKGGKTCGNEKHGYGKLHVTVMLCITANGNKLPPYVLNRKTVPKENFCKDVIVQAQKMYG